MKRQSAKDLSRILGELQQLHGEFVEQQYVRRSDGVERVGEALRRLAEIGSPAGILSRSAEELGTSSEFDIVVVSRAGGGNLQPLTVWWRDEPDRAERALAELERRSISLGYPSIEAEVATRHEPVIVSVAESGTRALADLASTLAWQRYAVADIALEAKTIGLLHAARIDDPSRLDGLDLELTAVFSHGLARAFERAVLREQLERQRSQLQSAARWISGQMHQLTTEVTPAGQWSGSYENGELADLLTARELEVLRLVAQGHSNRAIATSLVLGEGTVKYHVKNILRKLQARTRTEAVSRYMRLHGRRNGT